MLTFDILLTPNGQPDGAVHPCPLNFQARKIHRQEAVDEGERRRDASHRLRQERRLRRERQKLSGNAQSASGGIFVGLVC